MTAVDDRMVGIFENLEVPEGLKAELLRGEIVMTAGPDVVHNLIVAAIQQQVPYQRWRAIGTQDLSFPNDGSEPQPDLVVFERGAVEEHGRLLPAASVTLVVEVVSKTSVDRDYRVKRELYAEGTIAAYLIVDPLKGKCLLLTEPSTATADGVPDYLDAQSSKFGDPVPVPVLGLTLDTDEFQTYA
ncbi:Uma2 family endonuclease [Kitasatospora sp. RB6PN24]|uniref:Uma2 family endonuclease n=1 Tax=Kitasatospora humi TaxID=2893891 RepID=UPI001E49F41F|nr:Uma2 family endonuclease [Kitasatospora humi]MCC9310902.1 Uma2 family endonuclease [Kitasatospora humi]